MLLGLMGKKKAGKDTIADYLVNNHNFYNEIFAVYQKIQQRLKPIYHQ